MKTHSNVLAWEIPWTEEPGRLQFMGPQRVSTTECAHTRVSFCFMRMHSAPCVQGQLCSDNNRPSVYAEGCQQTWSSAPCTPHGAWSSTPLALYFVWETAAWRSVMWVGESFGEEWVAWPSHPPSNLRAVLSFLNVVFPDPENEAVVPLALHLIGCLSIFQGHRLSPVMQWLPT